MMRAEILADDKVIGTAELDRLDPPMGVAHGPFTATPAYERAIHAGEVDGQPNEIAADVSLTVRGPQGVLECQGVWIADFQDTLGEIQVSVIGISDYETYFRDYPDYRAYWGLG
jgi:hypothetical protein